jgi:hypothetical protein
MEKLRAKQDRGSGFSQERRLIEGISVLLTARTQQRFLRLHKKQQKSENKSQRLTAFSKVAVVFVGKYIF